LLIALVPGTALADRSNWREMTVGRFHLYSTLGDSATRNVARKLQAFEQTVGEILQSDDRLPDIPTHLFIVSRADFRKYATDRPGLAGFFAGREFANFIVMDGEEQSDYTMVTVFHEYTHFIQRNTQTLQLPPWYVEGYAELFSAFRIHDNQVTLGDAPQGLRVSLAKGDWIPVSRILAVTQRDKEYRAEALMPQFYGEAWTLVHYLLFDDAKLRVPTASYLTNLDLGYPEAEAFSHAFPFTKDELDGQIQKLLRHQVIVLKRWTLAQAPSIDEAPLTRLPAARADLEFARLCFELNQPKEIVQPLLDAALAENQGNLEAQALAARVAARFADGGDATKLGAGLGKGVDQPRVRMDLAQALEGRGVGESNARAAMDLLDGMVHAASPPLEAVITWARAAMVTDAPPAEVIAVLEAAQPRAPHNVEILSLLAAEAERSGDRAKARGYYTRMILVGPTAEFRAWAVRQADSERLQDPASRRR
jgi:hypothetical protein